MALKILTQIVRWLRGLVWGICLVTALGLLTTPSHFSPSEKFDLYLRNVAPDQRFDLASWIVSAFVGKVQDKFSGEVSELSKVERVALAERYFKLAAEEEPLRGKLLKRRAESAPPDEVQALERQVSEKRAQKLALERKVEIIVAEQIENAAQEEEFAQDMPLNPQIILPPVAFKFVAPPLLLVMSPHERIEQKKTLHLLPDMTLSQQEATEKQADRLGVVSLVVPIGGVGTYPTMVLETSSYEWTLEVVAHEWTHNYLDLRPLGMHYGDKGNNGAMTTINETVASIVGQELAYRARGLPKPDYAEEPEPPAQSPPSSRAQEFNYNREMRQTYLQVDTLLKEGKVAEAEAYMEERRKLFVSRGHALRKLNQAFFAFYGSYATGGVGAANPIGLELKRLRRASGSLKSFLDGIAVISSFEEYRVHLKKMGVPEGKR